MTTHTHISSDNAQANDPTKLTGLYGAKLYTWGSEAEKGNGMLHQIDNILFGGNVGHATLALVLPANEETKALVKKYCFDPVIPMEAHTIKRYKAVQDESGNFVKSNEILAQENVYVVFFSWFPAKGALYQLKENITEDEKAEFIGVNKHWDPRWKEYINPETRIHTGKLSKTEMTYGPSSILHFREFSQAPYELFQLIQNKSKYQSDIEALEVLIAKLGNMEKKLKKLDQEKEEVKFSESEIILLKRFKLYNFVFIDNAELQPEIKLETVDILMHFANDKLTGLKELDSTMSDKINSFKQKNMEDLKNALVQDEVKFKKTAKNIINVRREVSEKITSILKAIPNENAPKAKLLVGATKLFHNEQLSIEQKKERLSKILIELEKLRLTEASEMLYTLENQKFSEQNMAKVFSPILISMIQEISPELAFNIIKSFKLIEMQEKRLKTFKENIEVYRSEMESEKDKYTNDAAEIVSKQQFNVDLLSYSIEHNSKLLNYLTKTVTQDNRTVLLAPGPDSDLNVVLGSSTIEQILSMAIPDWKTKFDNVIDANNIEIIAEQLIEKTDKAKQELKEQTAKLAEIKTTTFLEDIDQSGLTHYITKGEPPDDTVLLPLNKGLTEQGHPSGLDAENMLKKMKEIASGQKSFDLYDYNCSTTVSEILKAGAPTPEAKELFSAKALYRFNTPQITRDNAMAYLATLPAQKAEKHAKTEVSNTDKSKDEQIVKMTARKTYVIENKNLRTALNEYDAALKADPNVIPTFSQKTFNLFKSLFDQYEPDLSSLYTLTMELDENHPKLKKEIRAFKEKFELSTTDYSMLFEAKFDFNVLTAESLYRMKEVKRKPGLLHSYTTSDKATPPGKVPQDQDVKQKPRY
ncbi:MAG: hypothetical protein JSS07_05670 [Proteobacteria bacterium]|nr:hypothetical protein [Pseudomonadota bacterium]